MKKCILFCLDKINVAKHITNHLIGSNHTSKHQKITGIIIMAIGVGISETFLNLGIHAIHSIGHIIGYGIHGIGLIPFIRDIENKNS